MNPEYKVSVIVPTRNVAQYIRECIESILMQTMKEIEILVIDAFSTDGTREIIAEYCNTDNRIILFDDARHSTGYAKNFGVSMSRAPYIAIVESDDYIEPEMLEKLYWEAEKTGADIVKGSFDSFIGDNAGRFFFPKTTIGKKTDYSRPIKPMDELSAFQFTMYEWLGIYRKSFLEKHHIWHNETKGASFQDIGFWFTSFVYAEQIRMLPDVLYHYRCDNPYASVKDQNKVFCTCDEYDYIRGKLPEKLWKIVAPAYYGECFHSNMMVYERLSEELRPILSRRLHDIFDEARNNGDIKKSAFRNWEWSLMDKLLCSSESFDEAWCADKKQTCEERQKLLQRCKEQSQIVIVCAGAFGTNLQYMLMLEGIEITAYTDNSSEKWGITLNGRQIMSPGETIECYPDALYLIANRDHAGEITECLHSEYGLLRTQMEICDVQKLADSFI